MHLKAISFT